MAKKKQPYIPLYTGDYIKDTRSLSLAAKGAWSDIILFMWAQETAGVIEGTIEDFARMIGGTIDETEKVLLELCLKKICDRAPGENGSFKIICRRLVKESQISEVRSESGSKGGSKTQANNKAKTKQKSDNDIDNDNDVESEKEKRIEPEIVLQKVPRETEPLPSELVWNDEIYRDGLFRLARSYSVPDVENLLARWEGWYVNKFDWRKKDLKEMRLSFEGWIKDPKSRIQNGKFSKNDRTQQNLNDLAIITAHASSGGGSEK